MTLSAPSSRSSAAAASLPRGSQHMRGAEGLGNLHAHRARPALAARHHHHRTVLAPCFPLASCAVLQRLIHRQADYGQRGERGGARPIGRPGHLGLLDGRQRRPRAVEWTVARRRASLAQHKVVMAPVVPMAPERNVGVVGVAKHALMQQALVDLAARAGGLRWKCSAQAPSFSPALGNACAPRKKYRALRCCWHTNALWPVREPNKRGRAQRGRQNWLGQHAWESPRRRKCMSPCRGMFTACANHHGASCRRHCRGS